jgi:glycine dehydrogenase subunit 1
MRYLPHTDADIAEMIAVTGAENLDALYGTIPQDCRSEAELDLPGPLTEWELTEQMADLAGKMAVPPDYSVFMGAGSYEHFIPESVKYLLTRSEFVTAYTPYQPEMSQGTLQAIYEYQTLVSRLLGMEVANASLYDGASSLAEALLMAIRVKRRKKVAVSRTVHPAYRKVARTYLSSAGYEVVELDYLTDGTTDASAIAAMDDLAAVAVQSPNFFGCIEPLAPIAACAHERGALLVVTFSEPLAYGLLKSPGSQGADIACGDGQSFGIPQSFGGPGLGMFATRLEFVRNMPGRLVGLGKDVDGKRGFVLTLATREQHIRRERATSNICTNDSLCALAAAMYMASLGGTGLRALAALNRDKAEYLKQELRRAGCAIPFSGPTFNEFVVRFPAGAGALQERLAAKRIIPGLPLDAYYPELAGCWLVCATETKSRADMDALVREIEP